jgi:hypothetical protein
MSFGTVEVRSSSLLVPTISFNRLADLSSPPELGAEIRVYSGSSGELHSGTRNHVPMTMVEINLEPHAPPSRTYLLHTTDLHLSLMVRSKSATPC